LACAGIEPARRLIRRRGGIEVRRGDDRYCPGRRAHREPTARAGRRRAPTAEGSATAALGLR
jgi:hypothetical protein